MKKKASEIVSPAMDGSLKIVDEAALLTDLRSLIQAARQRLATAANSTHTLLCWQVGRRLLRENLQEGRAAYGKQILATVSQELLLRARLHQEIENAREQEARRVPMQGGQP